MDGTGGELAASEILALAEAVGGRVIHIDQVALDLTLRCISLN